MCSKQAWNAIDVLNLFEFLDELGVNTHRIATSLKRDGMDGVWDQIKAK